MALSIINGACNHGFPTLATNLTVASVEYLQDDAVRVWFTLPPDKEGQTVGANDTNAYSVVGLNGRADLKLATITSVSDKAIDLYFTQNLYPGQFTISFVSSYFVYEGIYLPANTEYRFDVVLAGQEEPGLPTEANLTKRFLNPAFWGKPNWEAVIAGLEVARLQLDSNTQKAFRQAFISSASGKYLNTRASDNGIQKPSALGLTDEIFRNLVITILNRKLSEVAILELLEVIYGADSTHAYITSSSAEPFQLWDKASLDLTIDGQELPVTFSWADFYNASRSTAQEVCQALNAKFELFNSKGFAVPVYDKIQDKTFVRIYSGSMGLKSSVSITGGTCQPVFHFGGSLFTS
jgi:hypothetical protein